MPIEPGPFNLDSTALIFRPDNTAATKARTPSFYQELDDEFDGFAGHVLIQKFTFGDAWPTWEMHPEGDEFVYLLDGDTDFVLYNPAGEDAVVRVREPGSYVMVPSGVWHTARPHAQTTLLFVTPGNGTLNAERPSDG
ncbi:MAG: cupin [Pseudomonadota bacterium]